ncbi:bifunctional nuclease family protein [Candidatus Poribacteria bacterium]|nr:bifunctional nuclease family protein [Candidatus Poribacteria bacterium]
MKEQADEHLQMDGKNMIAVEVAFISIDASSGAPILFLRETEGDPKLVLPIWIGQGEALSIQFQLKGEEPLRPMTHDLMKNIIESLGANVDAVYVHTMKDSTYFGQIDVVANGKTLKIDARPSDSIALALRLGVPIYVAESIVQEIGFPETELREAERQQSQDELEHLDEETLGRYTV